MKVSAHRVTLAIVFLSTLGLVACGSSGSGAGDAAAGEMLVSTNACGSCHTGSKGTLAGGDVAMGGMFGPNLTPDKATGIGGWTDAQIKSALTTGKDDQGETLCGSMPRFSTMTDQDLADIIVYLRSLPAVSNAVADGDCTED